VEIKSHADAARAATRLGPDDVAGRSLLFESIADRAWRFDCLGVRRSLRRLLDLLRDGIRLLTECASLDAELVAEPAGKFLDDLDETLHGSQASGARPTQGPDLSKPRCGDFFF